MFCSVIKLMTDQAADPLPVDCDVTSFWIRPAREYS